MKVALQVGRFELRLGELKDSWFQYCRERGLNPSAEAKAAIAQAMNAKRVPVTYVVAGEPDTGPKSRVEIRLTPTESAAAAASAKAQGFTSTNQWVAATVRAALAQAPEFGKDELEALGDSNRQLLAIGRNLNQIAKKLNGQEMIGGVDMQTLETLEAAIRRHVQKVGDKLRASVYRWKIDVRRD